MDVVTRQGSRARTTGLAVVAAFAGFTTALIYGDTEPVDGTAWIYLSVATAVAAAVWFFAVAKPVDAPSGNTAAKVGLVLGILAVLSNMVFWIGYNGVLGAAALYLGLEGARRARRGEGRAGMAKAATILGALSVAAFIVIWASWGISELT